MARPPSPGPHSTLPRRLHIRPQQPPRANCQSEPVPVPSERPLRDGSGRPRASGLTCRSSRAEGRFSGGCPARRGEPCRDPPPCAGRTGRAMGPRPSGEGGRRRGASLSECLRSPVGQGGHGSVSPRGGHEPYRAEDLSRQSVDMSRVRSLGRPQLHSKRRVL